MGDPKEIAKKRGVGTYQRHVFLCTGPKCCTAETGLKVWQKLKDEFRASDPDRVCYRTKVGCFRICEHGPIAVVYPEGKWLGGVTEERVGDLVQASMSGDFSGVADLEIGENPLK